MSTFDPLSGIANLHRLRERLDELTQQKVSGKETSAQKPAGAEGTAPARAARADAAGQEAPAARFSRGDAPASQLYTESGKGVCTPGFTMEEQIHGQMQQMLDRETYERLVEDRERMEMLVRGAHANLTVMFADIRGFTFLASGMPPDRVFALLNIYHSEMVGVIRDEHGGCIDKVIGDGIMAFFGLPYESDHARKAVLAAVAMQKRVPAVNEILAARGFPPIGIGIGVNSGPVRAGFVTTDKRVSGFTIIGDTVNIASKYESIAAGGDVVVGEHTRDAIGGLFPTEVYSREVEVHSLTDEVKRYRGYRVVWR
ncbi:MAG: adenylate/guanylate cyclase domain-containing protein [bacterium]